MGKAGKSGASAGRWGPVCRGFSVAFADGERGRVEQVRVGEGGVALVVSTGLFAGHLVTIDGDEVEAILPRARRVVTERSLRPGREAAAVEAVGGIIRMPARDASRLGPPPEKAA